MKKPMSYGNFGAPIAYSSNSIIGGNPYSSYHSYNSTSYQIGHANPTGTTGPQNFIPLLSKVTQLSLYTKILIMEKIARQLANTDTYVDTAQVLTRPKIVFLVLRLWDPILFPFGTDDLPLEFSSHHKPIYLFILLVSRNFIYLFLSLFLIR